MRQANSTSTVINALRDNGFAIITDVLDTGYLANLKKALLNAQERVRLEIGEQRLRDAGELGVVRIPFRYDSFFFRLLELPGVLELVDLIVADTANLHLMNGFILPPFARKSTPSVFQNRFHRDFPRYLNGYVASVNVLIAVDEFRADNGATLVVPGSHQKAAMPDPDYMQEFAIPAECPAGSLVVFNSTLWHAAGANTSGQERFALNLQFTRSWIKQQIDYVRTLDEGTLDTLPERSQQLLGKYTRVVTNLDEYYRPSEGRLYRSGQG